MDTHLDDAFLGGAIINGAYFTRVSGLTAAQFYTTASYHNQDLSGIRLYSDNLTGWSFAGQNLTGTIFSGSIVNGVNWSGATLAGVIFDTTKFSGGSFRAFNLAGVAYYGCTFTNTDLSNADLSGAISKSSTFDGVNFSHANFTNAKFSYIDPTTFKDSDFTQADLTGATSITLIGPATTILLMLSLPMRISATLRASLLTCSTRRPVITTRICRESVSIWIMGPAGIFRHKTSLASLGSWHVHGDRF